MSYRKELASHAKRRAAIYRRHKAGESYTDIAKTEGISPARVGQIVRAERDFLNAKTKERK